MFTNQNACFLGFPVKAGLEDSRPLYHRVQEIPFSSERKIMEVRARPVGGSHVCEAFNAAVLSGGASAPGRRKPSFDGTLYFVKGMPEKVLSECDSFVLADGSAEELVEDDRTEVLAQSRKMAASGLRVLALAFGCSLGQLTFAGIVGKPRYI